MTTAHSETSAVLKNVYIWAAVVVAAAILVFSTTLFYPFQQDDLTVIGANPIVQKERVAEAFTRDYWAMRQSEEGRDRLYRPVTILSFIVNHAVGGNAPVGYRVVNILLHALASTLLLWMGLCLGLRLAEAGAAALLFALHPIHTETLNAVVGRADILAAVGVFAGMGLLLGRVLPGRAAASPDPPAEKKSRKKRKAASPGGQEWLSGHTAALAALFGVALLSKEIGIALLLCAGLWCGWAWLRLEGKFPWNRQALTQVALALAGVLAVYLVMRYAALGMMARPGLPSILDNPLAQEPFGWRQLGALGVIGRFFRLLIWPWPLSVDYSYAQLQFFGGEGAIWISVGAGLVLLWVVAAWRWGDARPEIAFGLALFIAGYFPVSNLAIPIGTVMAERTMYVPSAGFLLALAPAAVQWLESRNEKAFLGGLAAVGLLFAGMTLMRNRDWRDSRSLWESAVRVSPRSARALRQYGQSLHLAGKYEEAIPPLEKAVAILPAYNDAWVDLGIAQMQSGMKEEAKASLKEALRLNPADPEAHLSLGVLYQTTGSRDEARSHLERAVELNPHMVEGRFNLGTFYLKSGNTKGAIEQFRAALAIEPQRGEVHLNLAIALFLSGDREGARRHAEQANRLGVRLHPALARNLGLAPKP